MTTSENESFYIQCAHCAFFIEENNPDNIPGQAKYIHLCSGDAEQPDPDSHHNAEPGITMTLAQWKDKHPDLFTTYSDGYTGPNSWEFYKVFDRPFGTAVTQLFAMVQNNDGTKSVTLHASEARTDTFTCADCGEEFDDDDMAPARGTAGDCLCQDCDDRREENEGNADYPKEDWQYEVKNGDTKLGYAEWLAHKLESDSHDQESESNS